MREKTIEDKRLDYLTIAGIIIVLSLMLSYVVVDYVDRTHIDLSRYVPSVSVGDNVPGWQLPGLNLDWYYGMDRISKYIFSFLVLIVVSCAVGCTWIYLRYRKTRTS